MTNHQQIVSSVTCRENGTHDRVRVWNRGALAGELVVQRGDGEKLAARLREGRHLRIEPARETHIMASVNIVRAASPLGDDREAAWVEVIGLGVEHGEPFVRLRVGSIVWHEDGRGERGPDYTVRAWPMREWRRDGPRRIEVEEP